MQLSLGAMLPTGPPYRIGMDEQLAICQRCAHSANTAVPTPCRATFRLYTSAGETYVKVTPSPELLKLRDKGSKKRAFKVDRTYNLDKLLNRTIPERMKSK